MLILYLLCYAAVLIKFTCYAQNYADSLTINIQIYMNKSLFVADNLERLFY